MLGFQRYLYVFAIFKIKTLRWDKNEKDFFVFLDLLKGKDGIICDLGANIGIMTYHLAKELPKANIHSFEPIPDNISVLTKVCKRFNLKHVKIHPIAIGDSVGKLKMILPENDKTKMQGLSHVKHESITEWNKGLEFEVDSSTLDKIFENKTVSGIKIDIENYEYFAFLGGKKLLSESKPIIYAELWDNENRQNCFQLLQELGYKTYVVCDKELKLFDAQKHNSQNFIFRVD